MRNKPLQVGIIGVGNMGRNHVRVYSELRDCRVSAVCDINEEVGKNIAKKYRTTFYKRFDEMLVQQNLDIISVCVPTSYHFLVAKACLVAKKHVLLEKPITDNVITAKKLLILAEKHDVNLVIGHIERHNPAVIKLREIIQNGELGKIISLLLRRVGGFPPQIKDADIAMDLAIHDIDIANFLLNERPKKVIVNKQRYHIEKRDDTVDFFLKYSKASAYIQANWISPVKIRKVNVTGTEGYLEMDYITQTIEFYKSNYNKFKLASAGFSDYILQFSKPDKLQILVEKKEPLKEEIINFIDIVRNHLETDSRYALDALQIATTK